MIITKLDNLLTISEKELKNLYSKELQEVKSKLINKTGLGNEFLGWLSWPNQDFLKTELPQIKQIKAEWRAKKIDTVIVIGIGGSYIGSKAGIDMCSMPFTTKQTEVIFVSGIHSHYNYNLLESLKNKNWAIVVISKSGTTLETAINFRLFRESLKTQFKDEHASRIIAITDKNKGTLKELSDNCKYQTLTIPDDIGGRYSTLTSVGILTMALADLDIDKILEGWTDMLNSFKQEEPTNNNAMLYGLARFHLFNKENKDVEIFATYENNMRFVSEHYKQVFAESEGKQVNSILTTIANNSEDLHSIGQLYQEGINHCFETSLIYKNASKNVIIPKSTFNNDDSLDYISGKQLIEINNMIYKAVEQAHSKAAKIPHISIILENTNEYTFGYLMAFLDIAAATSAYLHGVNPFDQPGVEAYKSEMKKLIK
ncbi:MAG: glucose-6-phosphate isomerase [Mycoplasma sp.]